jgi:hypothetical protein
MLPRCTLPYVPLETDSEETGSFMQKNSNYPM